LFYLDIFPSPGPEFTMPNVVVVFNDLR
jgi:hypothetical protein